MNECPAYYRVADGREFWEWYRDECTPDLDLFCHDQAHALESACEYIFRAGRKTANPVDDFRKASSLIQRVVNFEKTEHSKAGTRNVVSLIIGKVVQAKIAAEIAEKPKTVDLTDPYRAYWTTVETHKP
jgi:hypothetical protein